VWCVCVCVCVCVFITKAGKLKQKNPSALCAAFSAEAALPRHPTVRSLLPSGPVSLRLLGAPTRVSFFPGVCAHARFLCVRVLPPNLA